MSSCGGSSGFGSATGLGFSNTGWIVGAGFPFIRTWLMIRNVGTYVMPPRSFLKLREPTMAYRKHAIDTLAGELADECLNGRNLRRGEWREHQRFAL